jgi:hypothetical protein
VEKNLKKLKKLKKLENKKEDLFIKIKKVVSLLLINQKKIQEKVVHDQEEEVVEVVVEVVQEVLVEIVFIKINEIKNQFNNIFYIILNEYKKICYIR